MILDVASVASCLAVAQHRGLVVGPRGTARHDYARGWTEDPTPWARAPSSGEGPSWVPSLDSEATSDRAIMWVADACCDHLRWAQYVRWYRSSIEGAPSSQTRTLAALLDGVRPSYAMCSAVLTALVAASAPVVAPRRAATIEEAAHVLGWDVAALRAAVKRGDVRSVAVEGKRARGVPAEELERLVGGLI